MWRARVCSWDLDPVLTGTVPILVPFQSSLRKSLRKEVIQPQVLLRLPCYDFVPVTTLAVGTPETR